MGRGSSEGAHQGILYGPRQGSSPSRHIPQTPSVPLTDSEGVTEWRLYGKASGALHREDGPAVVVPVGATFQLDRSIYKGPAELWFRRGQRHRDDGPAIQYADGTKVWYFDDQLHRDDGPAFIGSDGVREWYSHGERHRSDGPAVETPNGTRLWYQYGKPHREDGPAMISDDGKKHWYTDGTYVKRPRF